MHRLLWILCLAVHFNAWAEPGSEALYEATVPVAGDSEAARAAAFAEAMRQVLVRATGREAAYNEPMLSPLVREASKYVQQYRALPDGMLFVGFDGRRMERLIAAADPSEVRQIRLAIEGVEGVADYAEVTAYLESLKVIGEVEVEELSGQTVMYRASVRGGVGKLAQALALNPRFQAQVPDTSVDGSSTGIFRYRYSPKD